MPSYLKGNKRIPPTNIPSRLTFWSRTGEGKKPQPDNHAGVQAGKLEDVKDTSGLTVEGYQEFYDEACLAVLNNKYNDGIQWHDVPCYFRYRVSQKKCSFGRRKNISLRNIFSGTPCTLSH